MSDIRTVFIDMASGADYALLDFALDTDDGLETAVVLSLFTDARANDDDQLPAGQTDRRGWWGDAYAPVEGDRIGSRLWLLRRSKQLQSSLNEAREYAEEALAWMVEDGVAQRVEVVAYIPRFEVLGLAVDIYKPDGSVFRRRYESHWEQR
jgi:phage gp46-like protein